MNRVCFVDLDGVIVNRDARLARAREVYVEKMTAQGKEPLPLSYDWRTFDWETFCDPRLVSLDTLIEGAKEALEHLRYVQRYELLFLSSRPETMRAATVTWLYSKDILFYLGGLGQVALILKSPAFQSLKTPVWKAGMVQMLTLFMGVDTVLFVDDREENIQQVLKHVDTQRCSIKAYTSLADAVRGGEEGQ